MPRPQVGAALLSPESRGPEPPSFLPSFPPSVETWLDVAALVSITSESRQTSGRGDVARASCPPADSYARSPHLPLACFSFFPQRLGAARAGQEATPAPEGSRVGDAKV